MPAKAHTDVLSLEAMIYTYKSSVYYVGIFQKQSLLLSFRKLHTRKNVWLLVAAFHKLNTCQTSEQNGKGKCNLDRGKELQSKASRNRWSRKGVCEE